MQVTTTHNNNNNNINNNNMNNNNMNNKVIHQSHHVLINTGPQSCVVRLTRSLFISTYTSVFRAVAFTSVCMGFLLSFLFSLSLSHPLSLYPFLFLSSLACT